MTQSHNSEQMDQELDQEQLRDAAGGITVQMPDFRANKLTTAIDKSTPLNVSSGGCGGEDK